MSFFKKYINLFFYKIFINIIGFYQKIISPVLPARCRYYPTCSMYGKQALAWHGVWAGGWLLLKRIGRCHPLGGHGVDFVPVPLASYQYKPMLHIQAQSHGRYVYRDRSSYVARLNHLLRTR